MSFRTDAIIDWVEPGRLLAWRAHDRQKQLQGSRLVEPTGPASSLLHRGGRGSPAGLSRPLGPLVAWLLQRQTASDLRRLKNLLETPQAREAAADAVGRRALPRPAGPHPPGPETAPL